MLVVFIILILAVVGWAIWFICCLVPPKHLQGLPRPPLLKALYTFLTRPILEAIETEHWPLLFEHGSLVVSLKSALLLILVDLVCGQLVGGDK
ncbi:hypothetical protein DSO57_1008993 [Entomophthora muscae]|uniref:Uncharacterized protein n=1 Tax=Entomophthora muscae TaxID=34485 RepID=A0ACC2THN1_9FUNG|nr:hypothetical protein DSO57_1008993 [Entomophthora muscae]